MTHPPMSDFHLAILQGPAFIEAERRKREVLFSRHLGALRKIAMDGSADDCRHAREMAPTLEEMIALNKREYALVRERLRARSAVTAP